MPHLDLDPNNGIQDKRVGRGKLGTAFTQKNYEDNAVVEAALIAANASYYTQSRLDSMTFNDKVYALRTISDSAGMFRG